MKRAELLAAKLVVVLVDMAENVVETPAADHILRRPAGYPLRRLAPIHDAAVQVADIHAVAQRIQDDTGDGKQVFHEEIPRELSRTEGSFPRRRNRRTFGDCSGSQHAGCRSSDIAVTQVMARFAVRAEVQLDRSP